MSDPERTVRQLRLRVPDEAAARRLVPTLEDALRCASFGDEGARVIVVRRLGLGRVPAGISSQALSQRMETRVAAIARQGVPAIGDEAAHADCVVFAGALEARMQLAYRLLSDRRCDAWYWPLAVTEFDRGAPVRLNIARIALTIARWPEAPVALPRWAAALVGGAGAAGIASADALGVAPLASCLDDETGEALLCVAGLTMRSGGAARGAGRGASGADDGGASGSSKPGASASDEASSRTSAADDARTGAHSSMRAPRWLGCLLELAGVPAIAASSTRAPEHSTTRVTARPGMPFDATGRETITDAFGKGVDAIPVRQAGTAPPAVDGRSAGYAGDVAAGHDPGRDRAGDLPAIDDRLDGTGMAPHGAAGPGPAASPSALSSARPGPAPADDSFANTPARPAVVGDWPWRAPTVCGGLLFLLPVLARLDAPRRIVDDQVIGDLLHLALRRAHAPADDPMWRLAPADVRPSMAGPSTSSEAAALLADARRWLHRAGRIGLVRLVRRPALLSLTATHVDLHFALDACELRLRRLGLDLDPGWLPWFGRVVAFHYGSHAS